MEQGTGAANHETNDDDDIEEANGEDEAEEETQPLRRSMRESKNPSYLDDYILLAELDGERLLLPINDEPWSYSKARELKVWTDACDDEIKSIVKNKTWELVDLPVGAKAIGLKWIFKIKRNSDGSINKFKERLVAKGYIQKHGVDFEEVFALVARIETVRFLIALAASRGWEVHHLDVKTAFLHGDLKEEVYVARPEGFVIEGKESKVYKLHKALYGIRQSPRAWNDKLNKVIGELNFVKCSKEPALYRKQYKDQHLLVAVYVDDLLITGSCVDLIQEFKRGMSRKFEMSDLGRLTYYLGIEVIQHENGITLCQERHAIKIIEETGMSDCNAVYAPMEPSLKLSKSQKKASIDERKYRRNIGCLGYLLHTQLDLSFCVGVLSRYMQSPKQSSTEQR